MRIAVAGFQHETNTFAPLKATFADFETPDAWPGLTRGPELFAAVAGINLPMAGFVAEARSLGATLVPLTWCSATPSAHVTQHAYESILELILGDLQEAGPIDAVYLDLHGAMVAEHLDDADGETLRRVRAIVGPQVPIVANLDFHANVSPLMVQNASVLLPYRTYPHVDMAAAGSQAMARLYDIKDKPPLARALRQLPFLIPLSSQCTLIEPLRSIMAEVLHQERPPGVTAFTPGFPAADVPDCGPAVFGYGFEGPAVEATIAALAATITAREHEFAAELYSVPAALELVRQATIPRSRPVVLADTQDNPGGGGNADTTTLLKALVEQPRRTLAGVMWDAEAAARAHAVGEGGTLTLDLAAKTGFPGETPLRSRFKVLRLGDGRFTGTGPYYLGARMDLGPMALLETGSTHIAVSSRKQQAADQAMFRHLGVDPADYEVLMLKSSVHFRADFDPLASRTVVVVAPGPNTADPAHLEFRRLRPGVRLRPRSNR